MSHGDALVKKERLAMKKNINTFWKNIASACISMQISMGLDNGSPLYVIGR